MLGQVAALALCCFSFEQRRIPYARVFTHMYTYTIGPVNFEGGPGFLTTMETSSFRFVDLAAGRCLVFRASCALLPGVSPPSERFKDPRPLTLFR